MRACIVLDSVGHWMQGDLVEARGLGEVELASAHCVWLTFTGIGALNAALSGGRQESILSQWL